MPVYVPWILRGNCIIRFWEESVLYEQLKMLVEPGVWFCFKSKEHRIMWGIDGMRCAVTDRIDKMVMIYFLS